MNKETNVEGLNANPRLRQTNVISCFSEHHSYFVIPEKCKGKRMAFRKGWEAKQNGLTTKECLYDAKIINRQPTNPYYKYWHLGYECCQNSL